MQELQRISPWLTQIRKKYYEIILLITKVNYHRILNLLGLIDLYIYHNEYLLINNVLREYDDMKEAVKYPGVWS